MNKITRRVAFALACVGVVVVAYDMLTTNAWQESFALYGIGAVGFFLSVYITLNFLAVRESEVEAGKAKLRKVAELVARVASDKIGEKGQTSNGCVVEVTRTLAKIEATRIENMGRSFRVAQEWAVRDRWQDIFDYALAVYARHMLDAADLQTAHTRKMDAVVKKGEALDSDSAVKMLITMTRLDSWVAETKKTFWELHGLVDELKFRTWPKMGMYAFLLVGREYPRP